MTTLIALLIILLIVSYPIQVILSLLDFSINDIGDGDFIKSKKDFILWLIPGYAIFAILVKLICGISYIIWKFKQLE
jgi:hypothetical protein